jgi:hypothetical protein
MVMHVFLDLIAFPATIVRQEKAEASLFQPPFFSQFRPQWGTTPVRQRAGRVVRPNPNR